MSLKRKWTKTSSFLLPAAGLDVATLSEYNFENAYLNDLGYERPINDDYVDIFLVFNVEQYSAKIESFFNSLRRHSLFLDEYDIDERVVFRFKLLEEWKHIKQELTTSKYSTIDREYVKKFFNSMVIVKRDNWGNPIYGMSNNYRILTKHPSLRKEHEERLDVDIPEDLELWEKLHMREEILRF